ncbi:unnamed protein product [Rotaria sordida]|uniref:Uncharacterized protein n=1 Tax=Rotaria sordida TaxID=392033 RepID=A0A815R2P4_9BILA|nr:unnamed protein product [Rotaria sordida]CAF1645221.1 unnamed protein product [Rotaria sordida]
MCGKTQRQANYSVPLEENNSNFDSSCGILFFDEGIIGKESSRKSEEEINKVFEVSNSTSLNETSNDNQGVSSSTSNSISNKKTRATLSTSNFILNRKRGATSSNLILRSHKGLTSLTSSSKSHEKNSSTTASKPKMVTGNTESSLTISSLFMFNDNKSLTSEATSISVLNKKESISSESSTSANNCVCTGRQKNTLVGKSTSDRETNEFLNINQPLTYEQLQHENEQLREKINFYERHWMAKPTGHALTYFVDMSKTLYDYRIDEYEKKKKDKLKKISLTLNMTLDELESCKDSKHITITCRELVKFLYPDVNKRSTMKISFMSKEHVKAIRARCLSY